MRLILFYSLNIILEVIILMSNEVYSVFKTSGQLFSPQLIREFGAFDGLLLSALIQSQYSQKLYNDNYFEYDYTIVESQTGFTKDQQLLALNDLSDRHALTTKYEGVPVKCYIKLNDDLLSSIFGISSKDKLKIDNIKQFKKLATKPKSVTKGKNKFQQFYAMATEHFADKDLLELLYKYLQEKIGAISYNQWELCLKHLEEYGLQYSPANRKTGMTLMVEKAIAGGWFDFYKISDYELQQHTTIGYNQFGEPNVEKLQGDVDEWGKNCNFDLAVDENGNPIKF